MISYLYYYYNVFIFIFAVIFLKIDITSGRSMFLRYLMFGDISAKAAYQLSLPEVKYLNTLDN